MRRFVSIILLFISFTVYSQGQAPAPIVFFDIAGPNFDELREFYREIFRWDIADDGNFNTVVTSPLFGNIRKDEIHRESLVYIGVEDITATLAKIEKKGGTTEYPRFEVPGVVILGLFKDPAGNRVGLVEIENGKAKIP